MDRLVLLLMVVPHYTTVSSNFLSVNLENNYKDYSWIHNFNNLRSKKGILNYVKSSVNTKYCVIGLISNIYSIIMLQKHLKNLIEIFITTIFISVKLQVRGRQAHSGEVSGTLSSIVIYLYHRFQICIESKMFNWVFLSKTFAFLYS